MEGTNIMPVYDVNRDGRDMDGFGGGYIWIILLFFLFFAGGNNGFGGGNKCASAQEVQSGFDTNNIINGIRGLERGICDLGYAGASQTAGTRELILGQTNQLNSAIDNCCCSTKMEIMENRFANQQGFCNLGHAGLINTRDIIDNTNQGINEIKAMLNSQELARLRDENLSLRDSVRTGQLYDRLVDRIVPCATPSYLTCSPYESAMYARCGGFNGCGCN